MSYYAANTFITIFSMIIIQICVRKSNTVSKTQKSLFTLFFNIIAIAAFCEWFAHYLESFGPEWIIFHTMVKVIELSLAPSFAFILACIFNRNHLKEIFIFLATHSFIEILSGFFGFIFYIDSNDIYHHGKFYFIYVAVYFISVVYCCITVSKNIKKYQYAGLTFFLSLVVFIFASLMCGLLDRNLHIVYPVIGLVSIMCYVFALEMIQQTDSLTELLNRRGYENYISHIDQKCVVVFFDVDEFKLINDNFGHQLGDSNLKSISFLIKKVYSKYGKCFRYGGDEFCVILTSNFDNVESLNHDLFMLIGEHRKEMPNFPTVSIGYAFYDPDNQNIVDVIKEADSMMYKYKKTRKADL